MGRSAGGMHASHAPDSCHTRHGYMAQPLGLWMVTVIYIAQEIAVYSVKEVRSCAWMWSRPCHGSRRMAA